MRPELNRPGGGDMSKPAELAVEIGLSVAAAALTWLLLLGPVLTGLWQKMQTLTQVLGA
jgi:hypothetical protein